MSQSIKTLEQVLECILEGEEDRAAELIHEYVVDCARSEYQSILDEDDQEGEVDESVDHYDDIEREITDDEDEIEADSIGEDEFGGELDDVDGDVEDEVDPVGDMDDVEDPVAALDGDESDVEDALDALSSDLEELRSAFAAMTDGDSDMDSMDDEDGIEMDAPVDDVEDEFDSEDEFEMESVSYDLDEDIEEVEEDSEELDEATQLQQKASQQHKTGGMKGSEDDASNNESPFTNAPKPTVVKNGNTGPVKGKDGSDGNSRSLENDGKNDATHHNMKSGVDHKASPIQHKKGATMPGSADDGKVTSPVPKHKAS